MSIVDRLRAKSANPNGLDALLDDAAAEIERLRAALEPFANYAAELDGVNWLPDPCPVVADPSSRWRPVTVGDLRRARAALSAGK